MAAIRERDLRTRDRLDAERLRGVGERQRAVDTVAVGEGQGRIVEAVRCGEQCVGRRRSVEEGVG